MKKISIAIDGPASSGKSTVAKMIAKNMKYIYCDTGAMYRAITYLALQYHVAFDNDVALVQLIEQYPISFKSNESSQRVYVGKEEVTEAIRQSDVTNSVSIVAKQSKVRENLVTIQREIGEFGGVVMDGRDIGTAVLPNAEVKIFLIASVEERAQRRYKENIEKGILTDFNTLKAEIEKRDYIDSTRLISPLIKAKDAIQIDTTGMTIEEVVQAIENVIKDKSATFS